jgi:steroid 5-alpha reductase family enzyme
VGPARTVIAARMLRGLTGVLAGGLVALLVALVVAWVVSHNTDMPGPGTGTLVWHVVAVVVAVPAQIYADRRPGVRGVLAAVLVLLTAAALLTFVWFA